MIIKIIKKYISSLFLDPVITSPYTKDLENIVVVITGGSRGIGKAIGQILVREGASIVLLSRNKIPEQVGVYSIKTDIRDGDQVRNSISQVIDKFGHIDVLINNAGQFSDKPIEDVDESEFDSVMDTNIKGAFLVTKTIVPHMKKNKSGLIINIGSKISHNTSVAPKKVLYAMTKYAVEGFSLALSRELKKWGIRVTCLMLGTVNTFVSFKSKNFLSPYNVGYVISMIIKNENIDFESMLIKSAKQDI